MSINRDYYFTTKSETEIDPDSGEEGYKLYVEDNTDGMPFRYTIGRNRYRLAWYCTGAIEEVNEAIYLVNCRRIKGKHINTIFNNNGGCAV